MKKIDTLFLSGGGINSFALFGSFKYLIENDIVEKDFKNIKNIVCVSGSAFFILPLLLGYSLDILTKLALEYKTDKLIDYDLFDINGLLIDYGVYQNNFFEDLFGILLKKKNLSAEITMKELYDYTNINYVLKTTNLSKYKIEYINHITTPDIPVLTAIKMTSCIPFIFKPILYNGDYYVDGGVCGNYPIEYNKKIKSKNYFGIHIKSIHKNEKIENILDFFLRITMAPVSPYDDIHKKKKDCLLLQFRNYSFQMNLEKKNIVEKIAYSYQKTEEYFKNP